MDFTMLLHAVGYLNVLQYRVNLGLTRSLLPNFNTVARRKNFILFLPIKCRIEIFCSFSPYSVQTLFDSPLYVFPYLAIVGYLHDTQ